MNFSTVNTSYSVSSVFNPISHDASFERQVQEAINAGQFSAISKLVSKGVNPNMQVAVSQGDLLSLFERSSYGARMVNLIETVFYCEFLGSPTIEEDADPEMVEILNMILPAVLESAQKDFVEGFAPVGFDPDDLQGKFNFPLIMLTSLLEDDEATVQLLENGAPTVLERESFIDADLERSSVLSFIALFNLPKAARYCILNKQILPDFCLDKDDPETPFELALVSNNVEMMKLFLDLAPDHVGFVNFVDKESFYEGVGASEDGEGISPASVFEAYKPMIELFKEREVQVPEYLLELAKEHGYA